MSLVGVPQRVLLTGKGSVPGFAVFATTLRHCPDGGFLDDNMTIFYHLDISLLTLQQHNRKHAFTPLTPKEQQRNAP